MEVKTHQVALKEKVSEERTLLMEFFNSHFMSIFINDFYIKSRNPQKKLVEYIWEE